MWKCILDKIRNSFKNDISTRLCYILSVIPSLSVWLLKYRVVFAISNNGDFDIKGCFYSFCFLFSFQDDINWDICLDEIVYLSLSKIVDGFLIFIFILNFLDVKTKSYFFIWGILEIIFEIIFLNNILHIVEKGIVGINDKINWIKLLEIFFSYFLLFYFYFGKRGEVRQCSLGSVSWKNHNLFIRFYSARWGKLEKYYFAWSKLV